MSCGGGPVGPGPGPLSSPGIPGGTSCGHISWGIMGAPSLRQTPRILLDPKAPRHSKGKVLALVLTYRGSIGENPRSSPDHGRLLLQENSKGHACPESGGKTLGLP